MKRSPKPHYYVATLLAITRDMQGLATSPDPDCNLISACYRLDLLMEQNRDLHRQHPHGDLARVRGILDEVQELEEMIATTPARTFAGRHVKTEIALLQLEGLGGSISAIVRSALIDHINNATRDSRPQA